MKPRAGLLVAFLAAVLSPGPALAVDGVIELNQAGAGVNPNFLFVLFESGSYRLTSDIVVTDPDRTAIRVSSLDGDVDIDLNGFAIRGPNDCSLDQGAVVCTVSGTGNGIDNGASFTHLRVHNGTIRGMPNIGLGVTFTFSSLTVEDVELLENGSGGITTNDGARITSVRAIQNGGTGINVRNGSLVERSVATDNGADGFDGGSDTLFLNNVSRSNIGSGFATNGVFQGNVSNANGTNTLPGVEMGPNVCAGSTGGC